MSRWLPFSGGALTDWIDIKRGVKQGCPLSPSLFLDPFIVFISNLPNIDSFAFADDLAILSDSVTGISSALTLISEFSEVSGLGVKKDKSVAVPTSDPKHWSAIRAELAACPWPALPLRKEGTHLGI